VSKSSSLPRVNTENNSNSASKAEVIVNLHPLPRVNTKRIYTTSEAKMMVNPHSLPRADTAVSRQSENTSAAYSSRLAMAMSGIENPYDDDDLETPRQGAASNKPTTTLRRSSANKRIRMDSRGRLDRQRQVHETRAIVVTMRKIIHSPLAYSTWRPMEGDIQITVAGARHLITARGNFDRYKKITLLT